MMSIMIGLMMVVMMMIMVTEIIEGIMMVVIMIVVLVVFVRLFEQAEQPLFVPPIMMIERNFTCSNKKTNMDKNYIQRNSWTFGNPACQKI